MHHYIIAKQRHWLFIKFADTLNPNLEISSGVWSGIGIHYMALLFSSAFFPEPAFPPYA